MASSTLPPRTSTLTRPLAPLAGVLSYLVPGLGQIVQGRVAKGLLFGVCIYTLFFYGLYLGSGSVTLHGRTYRVSSNVYLPDTVDERDPERGLKALAQNLYNRPQFAGQFWVGIAAWPAIVQYLNYDRHDVIRAEEELSKLYGKFEEKRAPEVEAEDRQKIKELEESKALRHPVLGTIMREPSPDAVNAVSNAGDKRLELAWVYTVIAGVLNIMVIYDALAGPAFGAKDPDSEDSEKKA
jgi:hypothetical protein